MRAKIGMKVIERTGYGWPEHEIDKVTAKTIGMAGMFNYSRKATDIVSEGRTISLSVDEAKG